MKTYILLFFLIFITCCSVTKKAIYPFSSIADKEYAGTVITSTIIRQTVGSFTLIETDKTSIPIIGKVKIKNGTKCYFYYIRDIHNKEITMLIWEDALKGYELNK